MHQIGQAVLLDNGAFSAHTQGYAPDWPGYYAWCDRWLDYPTTSAIIPDVIDAPSQIQDGMLNEWPHGARGIPVWHLDEPLERLYRLCDEWPKVAFGSTGEFWEVLSDPWCGRVDEAFTGLEQRHRRVPWTHMLRGMQMAADRTFPFASLDSTDVAQNHSSRLKTAREMAQRWDAGNCPPRRQPRPRGRQDALDVMAIDTPD